MRFGCNTIGDTNDGLAPLLALLGVLGLLSLTDIVGAKRRDQGFKMLSRACRRGVDCALGDSDRRRYARAGCERLVRHCDAR